MQKILKGDKVQILVGKDSGKTGTVDRVLVKKEQVFVPGINVYKRHVNAKRFGQSEGGMIEISKPINISNVAFVCPSCKAATRVGFKIQGDIKARFCKKCGKEIAKA